MMSTPRSCLEPILMYLEPILHIKKINIREPIYTIYVSNV